MLSLHGTLCFSVTHTLKSFHPLFLLKLKKSKLKDVLATLTTREVKNLVFQTFILMRTFFWFSAFKRGCFIPLPDCLNWKADRQEMELGFQNKSQ